MAETVMDLIERAAQDPNFLAELQRDPIETARREGVEVSPAQLRHLMDMHEASEGEVVEALQSRLSYSFKEDPKPVNFADNTSACGAPAGAGI